MKRSRFGCHEGLSAAGALRFSMNIKKPRAALSRGSSRCDAGAAGARPRHAPTDAVAGAPNIRWNLDFVSAAVTDGRRFRMLAVVDDYSRECLALVAATSLSGPRVVRKLDTVIARWATLPWRSAQWHGADLNGDPVVVPELQCRVAYIAPGKSTQTASLRGSRGGSATNCSTRH